MKRIADEYKGRVRLVIKHTPYRYRDYSLGAAQAAFAAGAQGKYWEMHELLLARSPKLDRASLAAYAAELGLDVKRFAADLDGQKFKDRIAKDQELAVQLDLYSTPTYFINGRKVVGNRDYDYLKAIVDEELRGAAGK